VEDADATVAPGGAIEAAPGGQVRIRPTACELGQLIERAPVLEQHRPAQSEQELRAEKALLRVGLELAQHGWHGRQRGQPAPDLPELVDAHADEEDDERPIDVGGIATSEDTSHGGRSSRWATAMQR
jgi:hypothetical protein